MIIKSIMLQKAATIPGPGSSKLWIANGQDGTYKGCVKTICRDEFGYVMAVGVRTGAMQQIEQIHHHFPFSAVEFATVQYSVQERKKLGFTLNESDTEALANQIVRDIK